MRLDLKMWVDETFQSKVENYKSGLKKSKGRNRLKVKGKKTYNANSNWKRGVVAFWY